MPTWSATCEPSWPPRFRSFASSSGGIRIAVVVMAPRTRPRVSTRPQRTWLKILIGARGARGADGILTDSTRGARTFGCFGGFGARGAPPSFGRGRLGACIPERSAPVPRITATGATSRPIANASVGRISLSASPNWSTICHAASVTMAASISENSRERSAAIRSSRPRSLEPTLGGSSGSSTAAAANVGSGIGISAAGLKVGGSGIRTDAAGLRAGGSGGVGTGAAGLRAGGSVMGCATGWGRGATTGSGAAATGASAGLSMSSATGTCMRCSYTTKVSRGSSEIAATFITDGCWIEAIRRPCARNRSRIEGSLRNSRVTTCCVDSSRARQTSVCSSAR